MLTEYYECINYILFHQDTQMIHLAINDAFALSFIDKGAVPLFFSFFLKFSNCAVRPQQQSQTLSQMSKSRSIIRNQHERMWPSEKPTIELRAIDEYTYIVK